MQEFQKFIDHCGLVANFPAGALARLGLARGLALEAGADPTAREKPRSAFRDFLKVCFQPVEGGASVIFIALAGEEPVSLHP